jgi:hypothetical protein
MKPGRRFRRARICWHVRQALRMVALMVLTATVWLVTAYVCGRQALMITEEGARALMRQVLPGIW